MKLEIKSIEDITKLVGLVTALVAGGIQLSGMITKMIHASDLPDEEKEVYIARIRAAQDKTAWDVEGGEV